MTPRRTIGSSWLLIMTCLPLLLGSNAPGRAREQQTLPLQQAAATSSDIGWDSRFEALGLRRDGFNVEHLAVNAAGEVFATGWFQWAGTRAAQSIARWDGNDWQPVGRGSLTNDGEIFPTITALAVSGTDLYVGGRFTAIDGVAANHIAKWDGTTWSALGSGITGETGTVIQAIAIHGTDVYVGGSFTHAGGIPARNIAKWDGGQWSPLTSGVSNGSYGYIYALTVDGSDLYVGGDFTHAGGLLVNHIAKWNGAAWSGLKGGVLGGIGYVFKIVVDGSNLYIGGDFTSAGGKTAHHVARWDGSDWFPLPGWMPYRVDELAVVNSQVYIVNSQPKHQIRTWTGSDWVVAHTVADPDGGIVVELVGHQNTLYVGGIFTAVDTTPANGIAKRVGTQWHSLGRGVGRWGTPWTQRGNATGVYVSQGFNAAGAMRGATAARWDGTTWSPLGTGVQVVTPGEHGLYAVQEVTLPENQQGVTIVKWNGTGWVPLTSPISEYYGNPTILVILEHGTDLYVGGVFDTAGGIAAANIAKWDGITWTPLGSGIGGVVVDMVFLGDDLYAGGEFNQAGDIEVQNITKWDGSQWSPVGAGLDDDIRGLAAAGDDLYAVGQFWMSGETMTLSIANWNGSTWSPLGIGIGYGEVFAVAVDPATGAVYVGGKFDHVYDGSWEEPQEIEARNIAMWDGTRWFPLGTGVNGPVTGLNVYQGDLYVSGSFTEAGGRPSYGFARWAGYHALYLPLAGTSP